jgi:hypothetical protein
VLQSVRERSGRWWHELSSRRRSWSRPHDLAAAIRKVSQAQVLAFSELLVHNASSVSSWVVPAAVDPGANIQLLVTACRVRNSIAASFAATAPFAKYLGEPINLRRMISTYYED